MTRENGIGGTAVVAPGLKHSLRSASKAKAEAERLEEVALMKEEEKMMMDDEEITSEEDNDDETRERTMLTVALVKSVVETRPADSGPRSPGGDSQSSRYGLRKRRRASGSDLERLEHFQSSKDGGLARGTKPPAEPDEEQAMPPPSVKAKATKPKSAPTTKRMTFPNLGTPTEATTDAVEPLQPMSSVPNPLLRPVLAPSPAPLAHPGNPAYGSSVPYALSSASASAAAPDSDKRKVTIQEDVNLISRKRGLSIDLDCECRVGEVCHVSFNLYSCCFSVGLEFPDDASNGHVTGGGRDRAFSFECFAFGINADEPLPPLDHPGAPESFGGRPRGDSIIFDPVSFQDGGIHEQNALEKARSLEPDDEPTSAPTATVVKPAPVPAAAPIASTPRPAPSVHNPPAIPSTTPTIATAAASGTTVSLELLNKDGRIGIYLPEARRARIARFHAKRTRRIWRKRIKYDCRKKLADSRPRIKGRFVKRSDMED